MRRLECLAFLFLVACSGDDPQPGGADGAVDAAASDGSTSGGDAGAEAGKDSGGPPGCRPRGAPCDDDLTSCCSHACSGGVDFSACD